jgi:hypothetical protein
MYQIDGLQKLLALHFRVSHILQGGWRFGPYGLENLMSHTLKVRPEQIGGAIEPELDK